MRVNKIVNFIKIVGAILILGGYQFSEASVVKNVVLVHGAFTDGSAWSAVTSRLQDMGYHVTAVQNPLTSLAGDVAATQRVIERQNGDVLLVGHSWAGAVITQAGNNSKVRGLVYLSALVPDSGESAGELLRHLGAPMKGMQPDHNGLIWLDNPDIFAAVMAGDVPMEKVRALVAVQQPIAADAFRDKVSHAAWHDKPSWYLLTKQDHAIELSVQEKIARLAGAKTQEIASSHMSLVSHPDEVASLIDRAAREINPLIL